VKSRRPARGSVAADVGDLKADDHKGRPPEGLPRGMTTMKCSSLRLDDHSSQSGFRRRLLARPPARGGRKPGIEGA
jgi:hypothetical protein